MNNNRKIKRLHIPIKDTYSYIMLFNGIFGLTKTEISVLDEFIKMKFRLDNKGLTDNVFSTHWKKEVSDRLGRDDPNTLNNYIKSLKDKGAIIPVDDGYEFHWLLVPLSKHEEVRIIINP